MNDNLGLLDRLEEPEVGEDEADNFMNMQWLLAFSDQQSWNTNFLLQVWECLLHPLSVFVLCRHVLVQMLVRLTS